MKRELTLAGIILLALAAAVALIRMVDLIGGETLRLLAIILAVPGGVALMSIGLAPLVRAWRMPVTPAVERHIIKEVRLQQHTVDRRAPMPAPTEPVARQINLYPGLQSAEWRAGLLADGRQNEDGELVTWQRALPAESGAAQGWDDWE